MADEAAIASALQGMPSDQDVGNTAPIGPDESAIASALQGMPSADDIDAAAAAPTPPTRKLGPPRLHTAVHQPRVPTPTRGAPAGARGPAPAAPPPAPSWGQVFPLMAQNLVPSAKEVVGDTLEALKPQNWGPDITGLTNLAKGTAASFGIPVGASPQDESVSNAFWAAAGNRWGLGPEGGAGLRRSLAYHPFQNAMDLATVAAPLEGGLEAAGARLPGVAGDVATTAARVAGGVEAVGNPLGYPFRAAGLAKSGVGAVGRGLSAGDTADVADAVGAARRIHPTEPIANEMLTGEPAPPDQGPRVVASRAAWRKHVGDAATDMAGVDTPDPAATGQAFESAYAGSKNAAIDNFQQVGSLAGQYPPSFAPMLRGAVDVAFKKAGLPPPTGPGGLATLAETYPQTLEAMNRMHQQIDDLATANALTPKNIMAVRQNVGSFNDAASGSDVKGLRTLTEALDNHLTNMAQAGAFSGGDGAAVAGAMRNATAGWAQHIANFDEGPAATATQLLKRGLIPDADGKITSPSVAGTPEAVTNALGGGLINQKNLTTPGTSKVLYNHLQKVMGGPDTPGGKAVNNYLRASVLKTDAGNLMATPPQLRAFMKGPMARSAFPTNKEVSRVGDFATVDGLARSSTPKGARSSATLGALSAKMLRHGASIWGGTHFGPLGALAGEGFASHVLDPWFAERAARAAWREPSRIGRLPGRLGPVTKGLTRAGLAARAGWGATYQTPEEQQQEAEQNDRDITGAVPAVGVVAKGATDSLGGKAPPVTPTDVDTAVRMAAAEGDPTPEGWKAVAAVMRNRSLEGGGSLSELAAAPRQFEAYGNRNYTGLQPGTRQYNKILAAIAPVLAGKEDPTGGADQYYSPSVQAREGRKPPSWDDGTGQMIGTQRFFKNKYRQPHAAGGRVIDLAEHLLRRSEQAQKADQASTKPLLGLSDDTVAQALRVAQRGL